jgi:hypothetical protein
MKMDLSESGTQMANMTNVIGISDRLRDGREINTAADFQQWMFENLFKFSHRLLLSQQLSPCWGPIDIFPAITKVMVEWCRDLEGWDYDKDNAQALARAISELTDALGRCLANLEDPEPDV